MPGHYTTSELRLCSKVTSHENEVDFLIIGAGMAGLYSAYQLMKAGGKRTPKILIVDKIFRTGGRLDSDLVSYDGQTVREEEGAMRFTFEYMTNLMALLIDLCLVQHVVPFPMGSDGANRRYFRGESFDVSEAKKDCYKKWSELYRLLKSEQGFDPATTFEDVFIMICKANPGGVPKERTPEFWQRFRLDYKWNGIILADWSMWNLMVSLGHSNEFITLLYFLSGFNGTMLSNMSAGGAFELLLDFPSNPDFKTLDKGFSILPNALVDFIGKDKIMLNTQVTQLARNDGGITATYLLKDGTRHQKGVFKAKHVIMALPRLAVEKIVVASPLFTELERPAFAKIWNTLLTTTNQSLVKINLYYENAWWGKTSNPQVAFGPNFSDLPLGSVYPFYTIDPELFAAVECANWYNDNHCHIPPATQAKIDAVQKGKYSNPAALTIYCDGINVEFWRAAQNNGELFDSPLQQQYSKDMQAASLMIVKEATKYFQELFNTQDVPQPVLTSSRIWSGTEEINAPKWEQVGYGVHVWANGANDRDAIALLAKPLPDANVYICGEAYSDYQLWVEGALRSANVFLEKEFGIKSVAQQFEEKTGKSSSDAIAEIYDVAATERIRKYIEPNFPPRSK